MEIMLTYIWWEITYTENKQNKQNSFLDESFNSNMAVELTFHSTPDYTNIGQIILSTATLNLSILRSPATGTFLLSEYNQN